MALAFYSPVLFVKDIERSRKFYTDLLEQETEYDFGKNIIFKSRVSLWEVDPASEIAGVSGNPSEGNTFELYFETEDMQGTLARLKTHDITFLHELKTEPWGQMTFRFFDPDHHLVEIGESMATFVRRIYKETGSVTVTSAKTGIPEKAIREITG
ncbi:MAG: VOC family protein [Bacteroidales bacterium]|jgi:catechol 2,3-dioxygenase-like lactoylglutathione lyase family enzyme